MTDFRELVDQVRERTDLAQLIGEDIALHAAGSVLKGSSPFRSDRDPSFVVWPHTQTWRDFSGGAQEGGDCIDYVMARDRVGFWPALHTLAQRAGLTLPGQEDPELSAELDRLSQRRRVEGLLTEAARYYHQALPSKLRTTWLKGRYGFTDETIEKLQLGWADGHLYEHLTRTLGASEEDALATGLFVRFGDGRTADFFQQRLVFPYWRRGRAVYFIARQTQLTPEAPWEEAKYKKLLTRSEKHPYVSSIIQNDTFYNEDVATSAQGQSLLVTEGVTDCISAMQAGVPCISPVTVRFRKKDLPKLIALTERVAEVVICNDAEASGAGEAGALETAAALQQAGRIVRIARLPRPEGKDKLDLNELVSLGGPEALHQVLHDAPDWITYQLERIPADAPKHKLNAQLDTLLPHLRSANPILRDGYASLIKRRFKLRMQTVWDLLREPAPERGSRKVGAFDRRSGMVPVSSGVKGHHDKEKNHADSQGGERRPSSPYRGIRGEVLEAPDHYYTFGHHGEPIAISSFVIKPLRRIITDDGHILDTEIITKSGNRYRNIRFPKEAWNSKRQFLRFLKAIDMIWTGTDENVQGVLNLISEREVPTIRGITNLGYTEFNGEPMWVVPERAMGRDDVALPEDMLFLDSGDALHKRLRPLDPVESAVEAALAAQVLPKLLELNMPEVILPILGWFFATPLKPRIQRHLGHFPTLCVWGTQGSGKSSLVMEVFWPLFGMRSSEPFSATETEFSMIKLLSATNSIPVFIDEYKPFDMPKNRRNTLHRYIRRLYAGELESRGRADQTVSSYRLSAPLCLAGETRPIESALVERIITANPSKDTLPDNPKFVRNFKTLKSLDLGLLTRSIIRHMLGRDTQADLDLARHVVEQTLGDREVPMRMKDNFIATVCGLIHFEGYAESFGIKLPELDVSAFIIAQCDDLLESGGRTVKTGLDYFLEMLSSLAVSGGIEHYRQYTYTCGHLALHIPSCHAAYAEQAKRAGYEGELLDKKALLRQLQENRRLGGYVVDVSRPVSFGTREDKRRAVIIDLEKAKSLLDVDDFPRKDSTFNNTGYVDWNND